MSAVDRISAVPYVVLGETRRQMLGEYVRACVERWRSRWIPEQKANVRVTVLAPRESHDVRLHDATCFRLGDTRTDMVLIVPARCLPLVAGVTGDVGEPVGVAPQPHGLAELLELEALRALAREFRTTESLNPTLERMTCTATEAQREYAALRYATVLVTLGDAKSPVVALLSPELMAAAIPARGKLDAAESLEPRNAAIAQEVIAVEAVLGEGEVSVSELTKLAVGDVVVLEQKLGEPASLAIRGGGRIVGAAPGRVEGVRAVQIKREGT